MKVEESLRLFPSLLKTIHDVGTLDRVLGHALVQYAAVSDFEYALSIDHEEVNDSAAMAWAAAAVTHIEEATQHPSATWWRLDIGTDDVWGCRLHLAGHCSGTLALRHRAPPREELMEELTALIGAWLGARESACLSRLAAQEKEMEAEEKRNLQENTTKLVAGIAHDVNTPLGICRTAVSYVQDVLAADLFQQTCTAANLGEELEDALSTLVLVERNIQRAVGLIESFKNHAARQLSDELVEVDFGACVQEIVAAYSPEARKAQITVAVHNDIDPSMTLWTGYPGYLSQILFNFLVNAKRYAYATEPGKIDITVSSVLSTSEFRLVFQDYGAGIPSENLPLVFEAFFTTGRDQEGTGLGLANVKNIVEKRLRGRVQCDSTLGSGTTFTVNLPMSHEPEEEMQLLGGSTEVLREFVDLQGRVSAGETLSPEEQGRLTETKLAVDRFFDIRFKGPQSRARPRIPYRRQVTVYRDEEPLQSTLRDISAGGAAHAFELPVEAGTTLEFDYFGGIARIRGSILRVTKIEDRESKTSVWLAYVKFVDLDDQLSQELCAFMAQLVLGSRGADGP